MRGMYLESFAIQNNLIVFTLMSHVLPFIHSFNILYDDRSKASSKTIPPHSAI